MTPGDAKGWFKGDFAEEDRAKRLIMLETTSFLAMMKIPAYLPRELITPTCLMMNYCLLEKAGGAQEMWMNAWRKTSLKPIWLMCDEGERNVKTL